MSDPQSKADKDAGLLGKTAKSYAKLWARSRKWGREPKQIDTKQIMKGNICEEDGFDLISAQQGIMVYKNPIKLENEWATGTPDMYDMLTGELISKDNKCSYDWQSFPDPEDELDKVYEWQNLIYAWLAGKDEWTTTHTLVNAPASIIRGEKESAWYKLGKPDRTSDVFVNACIEIEKRFIYDMDLFLKRSSDDGEPFELHCKDWNHDIPASERILERTTKLDMAKIEALKVRVEQVRKFLKQI